VAWGPAPRRRRPAASCGGTGDLRNIDRRAADATLKQRRLSWPTAGFPRAPAGLGSPSSVTFAVRVSGLDTVAVNAASIAKVGG